MTANLFFFFSYDLTKKKCRTINDITEISAVY